MPKRSRLSAVGLALTGAALVAGGATATAPTAPTQTQAPAVAATPQAPAAERAPAAPATAARTMRVNRQVFTPPSFFQPSGIYSPIWTGRPRARRDTDWHAAYTHPR